MTTEAFQHRLVSLGRKVIDDLRQSDRWHLFLYWGGDIPNKINMIYN